MLETSTFEQLYARFAPDERARLSLAALSRNDLKEDDRLRRTCSMKFYRMRDLEFVYRMETAREIALIVQCDLNVHVATLRALLEVPETMFPLLSIFENHAEAAFFMGVQFEIDKNPETQVQIGESDPDTVADENQGLKDWVDEQKDGPELVAVLTMISASSKENRERFKRVLNHMMERPARKLVSRLAALQRFTQKTMGLGAMAFLDAFCMPVRYFLPSLQEQFSAIKPDDGEVDEYATSLEEFWHKETNAPR